MKRSLTDEQVNEARRLYFEEKLTQREIAERYNCSIVTISLWVDPNDDRRQNKFHPVSRKTKKEEDFNKYVMDIIKTLKDEGYSSMAIHKMTHLPLEIINAYYIQCPVDFDEVYSIA